MFERIHSRQALAVGLALYLALPASALALETPRSSRLDHRVRYVTYNAADVIQLDAVIGVATHIVLAPGEHYVYHVFGDSQAYAFTYKGNHLFFKPTAKDANTNLIVVTDRHDYSFRLSYSDQRGAPALYKLVIRYPEEETRQRDEAAQKAAIERSLKAVGHPLNWQAYTRSGDAALAPIHAWDDGRQTWLQFSSEADIPAVYRVTPDGQEVLTNFHMADERTMVLHRTSALWHLRLGNQVLAIHNEAYGAAPIPTRTGTVSPAVKRRITGTTAPQQSAAPRQSSMPVPAIRVHEAIPARNTHDR
ncbi:TrbG/VirB9 family P-type conjugative transfer protein [Candidimonas nitroreducens]|jgi:type IV secretion system protein VirB9|uniref:Type VI secretion protein n=1 Tax=Candidimonas nitroreducens TaxID=683354 RepID=A0A225N120_9BURK|nr:TrbG/VirB9 family P-type conjugative transfer protein [Candidimonas nitroreducens]OWT65541.1 type VI secretion protein [Candidimonas nitroreducens]